MDEAGRNRAETLFQKAADLDPDAREAFLDAECGGDDQLRKEVDSLLAYLDNGSISSLNALDDVDAEEDDLDLVGTRIGPYELKELIGEGGFGSVYQAEQKDPIQRTVALKVIKLGMDTKQIIGRFEIERQALAMMDHPNIARVLDAGTTDRGRPYFVMELVRGIPITKYCDQYGLSLRQRLQLFMDVCQAVQHAHQKGIIHRDIKPSNVLVSLHDGKPVPKVIDFGIAKATDKRTAETSLSTSFHIFIGTPEYMSPEQAEVASADIDTRTDIYSLGVLLYVLLTGMTPFDASVLQRASYGELQRIIRDIDPPTPSQRVSKLGVKLAEVAALRKVAPQSLSRIIRGDLDWIVMKALAKDRRDRYETAAGFAEDIHRYIKHEPVTAGPPSRVYLIRKFMQRHKTGVATGLFVFLALVVGLSLATWGFFKAEEAKDALQVERDIAEKAQREAESARVSEQAQRERAEASARSAQEEVVKFAAAKKFLDDMLASAHPVNTMGREPTIRYVLEESTHKLNDNILNIQPEVEAAVRMTIGKTYMALGMYFAAESHLKKALTIREEVLGPEHEETLYTKSTLADLLCRRGSYYDSEKLYRATIESQHRLLGKEHPDTLDSMNGLGISLMRQGRNCEAELLHLAALNIRLRVKGEESEATLKYRINLGTVLWGQRKIKEAEETFDQVLKIGGTLLHENHPLMQKAMNNLALVYQDQGRFAEAEHLFRQALEADTRVLGGGHPSTQIPLNNLKNLLKKQGRVEEYLALEKETVANRKRAAELSQDAVSINDYAWILLTCEIEELRDPETALDLAIQAVELDDTQNANLLDTLALAYWMNGDHNRAVTLQLEAVALAGPATPYRRGEMVNRLIDYLIQKGDLYQAVYVIFLMNISSKKY